MLGIDLVSDISEYQADVLQVNKVELIMQYIVPKSWNSYKATTMKRINMLLKKGFRVGLVWEGGTDGVKGGAAQGRQDAQAALVALRELAIIPCGVTIYFATDYDAQPSEYATIEDYYRAASEVLNPEGYTVSGYGGYYLIEAMLDKGCIKYGWQTLAWSRKNGKLIVSDRIALFQKTVPQTFCGLNVDLNDSYGVAQGLLVEVDNERMVDEDMSIIADLKAQVDSLQAEVVELQKEVAETPAPSWVVESRDKALAKHVIAQPESGEVTGRFEFWRTLRMLDNAGLLG